MDAIRPTVTGAAGETPAIAYVGPSSSGNPVAEASTTPVDQVQISDQGSKTAEYIKQARNQSPVNIDQETIKKLKAAIAKGNYPAPALIQGLINLTGSGFSSEQDA
ncbi:Anti-sigma-28 factor, FlgM [Verrucomicrobium sp. GAS474]|uniref:flagellar biosynthesis anti-sigma factor FlgM n=1 Tax=Verrucomicrobium sp. GAS474 TaxID=1882831 RepID=UPI00087A60D5|nr:flagellar biosynthesis anti-sigma factor FlgM [Verrucomicrobium sp. GAS474]SDT88254.1 Anti-sigma-28 factor, FlgM [Verrucomicrobium sp. GAS474]